MWNFSHLTANSTSIVAPPLRSLLFLRGGTQWKMLIPLTFSVNVDNVELSFRDNAGTRGDYAGTVPVIGFGGTFTGGAYNLIVTLRDLGSVKMGLKTRDTNTGNSAMFEMDWVIVR